VQEGKVGKSFTKFGIRNFLVDPGNSERQGNLRGRNNIAVKEIKAEATRSFWLYSGKS